MEAVEQTVAEISADLPPGIRAWAESGCIIVGNSDWAFCITDNASLDNVKRHVTQNLPSLIKIIAENARPS